VFAHGFGCDQNMWRLVAPEFERTHRVVLFDYVGAGKSDRAAYDPRRYASLDGYARDVLEICEALELREAVFVGHSVSAMIGALAAVTAPGLFRRLVMVGPSPRYIDDPPDYVGGFQASDIDGLLALMDQNFMGWATALSEKVLPEPVLGREVKDSFCSTDPVFLRQFAEVTFRSDHRALLSRVEAPSLVLQCARDDIAPVCVGEYVARRLPRGTYRLVDVAGHMPHMNNPRVVVDAIRDYLAGPA